MPMSRPSLAFALTLAAATLVLTDGAIEAYAGSVAMSLGYVTAGAVISDVGILGLLFGWLLLVLALGLYFFPKNHTGIAIAIFFFSLLSIIGGGGFIIGVILGVSGGILGFVFEPEETGTSPDDDLDREHLLGARTAPSKSRCPTCEAIVYADEILCMNCGLGLTGRAAAAGSTQTLGELPVLE